MAFEKASDLRFYLAQVGSGIHRAWQYARFYSSRKVYSGAGGMSDDEFIYEIIAGGGRFNVAAVRREICGTPPVPGMSLFF